MKKKSLNSQRVAEEEIPENQPLNQEEDFQLTQLQKVIDKVGGEGRYQLIAFIIFCGLWFFAAWTMVGQSFFFQNQYTCKNIQDKDKCQEYICSLPSDKRASEIKWHSDSITFAFNDYLICDFEYLSTIFISIFYFGSLVGFFVIPSVADNFGRRIAMLISWAIYGIGVLTIGVSFHPALVGIGEFLAGFGCNPAITLCYSFINEQCLRGSRQHYGVGIQIFIALGQCLIGLLFLPDLTWRYVFFLLFGLIIVNFIALFYLLETPKFLLSRDKEKTLEVLNKMAKRNKKEQITIQQIQDIEVENNQSGASVLDLFRYKSLRTKTIAAGITFLGIQAIYYSTLLNLDNAGFDKLTNQQIIGASQAISYIATEFFISKVKRKKSSIIGMGLASLFCFILAALELLQNENNENAVKLASTIGLMIDRFVLCSFWSIFYVYIAEMYPTRVRSLGFGWASAMGTVGSTVAPYLILFAEQGGINTWILPGVIGCISTISLFFLTETYGKPLQDEIEEMKIKTIYE